MCARRAVPAHKRLYLKSTEPILHLNHVLTGGEGCALGVRLVAQRHVHEVRVWFRLPCAVLIRFQGLVLHV